MTTYDVLVLGEINADLILRGDVEPAWQQHEKIVDDMALVLGGSSAIFACGIARLGLRVAYVGVCGPDTIGQFCVQALNAAGVDTSHVIEDPQVRSGLTVVLQKPDDRAMLTYEGGIPLLRAEQIPASLLAASRHIHIGSYYLQHALRPGLPHLFARMRAKVAPPHSTPTGIRVRHGPVSTPCFHIRICFYPTMLKRVPSVDSQT